MEHRLYRDKAKAIAGGVAAGIGNYLRIDTALVRAIFVLLVLFGRTGVFSSFVVYCILWIAIPPLPENLRVRTDFETDYRVDPLTGEPMKAVPADLKPQGESSRVFGFILLGLGLVFLADRFIDIDWDFDRYWPALLIIAGVVLLLTNRNRNRGASGSFASEGSGSGPGNHGTGNSHDPAQANRGEAGPEHRDL